MQTTSGPPGHRYRSVAGRFALGRRTLARGAAGTSAAVVLGGALVAGPWAATAARASTPAGDSTSFGATGARQVYTVPAGVYEVTISADGAHGGNGSAISPGSVDDIGHGGAGGHVEGTVFVTPGEQLLVDVGKHGADASSYQGAGAGTSPNGTSGGEGGMGNLWISGAGGGGGGESEVSAVTPDGPVGIPLVIAGGGGGGGGAGAELGVYGGDGGSAGSPGTAGRNGTGINAGAGGPAAAATGPGQLAGGIAVTDTYSGGGGGGGAGFDGNSPYGGVGGQGGGIGIGGGGGGGAGGSYLAPSATNRVVTTSVGASDGLVEITPLKLVSVTTLQSSVNPVLGSAPVTLTATVAATATEPAPTPTGTVYFVDASGTTLGSGTVDANGHATLTLSTLPVGSDDITAEYAGTTTYDRSRSATLTEVRNSAHPVTAPGTLTFANAVVGSTTTAQSVNLANDGNLPLHINATTSTAPFTITANTCAAVGPILQPGEFCTIYLAFTPGATGTANGTLTVTTDGGTATAALVGTALAATPPNVTGVSPSRGYTMGGLRVTVTGTGLSAVTGVTFGTTPATLVGCTDTSCVVTSPEVGQTGGVDIRLTGPTGTSPAVAADLFYYLQHS